MKKDINLGKTGKIKIGVPFFSEAYKNKTPRKIKLISDSLVFLGSTTTIIAATLTPPGWVIMLGGLATLSGRFLLKCIGEN